MRPVARAGLGAALSGDGDWLAVGAWDRALDGTTPGAGAVHLLRAEVGGWVERARALPGDPRPWQHLGSALALSDSTLVAGAPGDAAAGEGSGAAYVFELEGGRWTEAARLTAPDAAPGDFLGYSVALAGERALVGAYRRAGRVPGAGAALLFERGPDGWRASAELVAADGARDDYFGHAVGLVPARGDSPAIALVGAHRDDDAGSRSGAVYAFALRSGGWVEEAKLTAARAAPGDRFGHALSLAYGGDGVLRALVGARMHDGAGVAFVFERRAGTWREAAALRAPQAGAGSELGFAVCLRGDLALCGARREGPDGSGAAHLFARDGDAWVHRARLAAPAPAVGAELGAAVALVLDAAGLPRAAAAGAWRDPRAGPLAGGAFAWALAPD